MAALRIEFDYAGRTYTVESPSLTMWNVHIVADLRNSMTLETDITTGERIFVAWNEIGVIRLVSQVDQKGFAVGSAPVRRPNLP